MPTQLPQITAQKHQKSMMKLVSLGGWLTIPGTEGGLTGRPSTPLRNIYVHIETLPVRALKASWHTPHRTAFFFPTYSDPPSVNIPFFCNKIFGSSRVYKTSSSKLWNSFSSLFFYVWLKKLNLRTVLKSFWCRSGPSLYPLKPCISSWSLPARRYSCPYLGGKGSYQISQELNVFWHLRNFASWKCPSFDFLKKWEKKGEDGNQRRRH